MLSSECCHYVFLKVGTGNKYLQLCRNSSIEGVHIGFHGHEIPEVDESGYVSSPRYAGYPVDLKLLASLSSEKRRSSIRVISFSPSDLVFWGISGDLREITQADIDLLQEELDAKRRSACYQKSLWSDWEKDVADKKAKILPVKEIETVPRRELLPTVNSLAVYQYLNRGTFRAISCIAPGSNANHPWAKKELLAHRISYDREYEEKMRLETKYGYFVRRYLDFAFDRKRGQTKGAFWEYLDLPSAERLPEVVLRTLNPAQVETAAALLVLDLGLTPEIAVAKALDHIDVRARARRSELQRLSGQAREKLDLLGCKLSPHASSLLEENGVLQLQCKAYDAKCDQAVYGDQVLLVKPFSKGQESNTVALVSLFERFNEEVRAASFPHLHNWLSVLAEDLE